MTVHPSPPPLADHLIVFGRPGSGKSSLAERLRDIADYEMIRTGELLRAAIRRRDSIGLEVEGILAQGRLASDEQVLSVLRQALETSPRRRLLFDGFPRTLPQVPLLAALETEFGFRIGCYLEIAIDRAEAEARMTGRRICPVCGTNYHLKNAPPRVEGVCDRDGTPLVSRRDDTSEIVAVRQDVFDSTTGPVLDYFRTHEPDRYRAVDGTASPAQVEAEVRQVLGWSESRAADA